MTLYEFVATTVVFDAQPDFQDGGTTFPLTEITEAQMNAFVLAMNDGGPFRTTGSTLAERRRELRVLVNAYLAGLSVYSGPDEVLVNGSISSDGVWKPSLQTFAHPADTISGTVHVCVSRPDSTHWRVANAVAIEVT